MSQAKRRRQSDEAGPSSQKPTQESRALARAEQAAAKLSETDVKKLEIELARYLIFADKKNIPVKKQDLVKNILKEQSKLLPTVLEGARKYLKQTFDFSVSEIDYNKSKYYLLKNNVELPDIQLLLHPSHQLPQLGLLMVLLSLIHMADNALDETELWNILKVMGIERGEAHIDFGDTEKLINEFVKQMYIEKQKVSSSKGQVTQYHWGVRAYHEIKMSDVLRFVAVIYDVDITVWKKQFSKHAGAPANAT